MRILLLIVAVPLLLLIGIVVLVPVFVDERALIVLATDQIETQSGAQIAIRGDAKLRLFPKVAVTASDVLVTLPDDVGQIEADYLQTGVALFPLLSNRVEVDNVLVRGLSVTTTLEDEAAAAARAAEVDTSQLSRVELDAFYAARRQARQAASDAAAAALAAPLALQVGELVLQDIHIRRVDEAGEPVSELLLKQLTGRDLNTAGRSIPLTGQLQIPGNSPRETIDVIIEGRATIDVATHHAALSDFNIIVRGATPDPVQLRLDGVAATDTRTADLKVALTIGDLRGDGEVRFDSFGSPVIDADLTVTELNPALLLLAGPGAGEITRAAEGTRPTSADTSDADTALPLHALRMIDTRAQLAIDTLVLDGHRLERVTAELRILEGVATLDPVSATLHGGQIEASLVFNGRYNTAELIAEGAVQQVDVAQALAAAQAGVRGRGVADLSWQLRGSGSSSGELTSSLAGPVTLATENIVIEDIALQNMFCQTVALLNQQSLSATYPSDTQFESLSAQVRLAGGVATLDPLTAELPTVALSGTGSLDLNSQDLRLDLRAQLIEDPEKTDPACRVDERLTTIRWPVACRGNLADDPSSWCGIDTQEIIRDLAANEARREIEEAAGKLLKKLFD